MNTPQLTVLWYAGLLIAMIMAGRGSSYSGESWQIASIIVLASLFIYTFRPHPKANKKVVAAWVIAPFLLIALSLGVYLGWIEYQKRERLEALRTKAVEGARKIEPNSKGETLIDDPDFKTLLKVNPQEALEIVTELEEKKQGVRKKKKGTSIDDLLLQRRQERDQLEKEFER